MPHIDLNADLGEGCGEDAALMPIVSRCNIACGGHAGDSASMRETLLLAIEHGVVPGAHPSYPDREGFGRRPRFQRGAALEASLAGQLDALAAIASELGVELEHLKPHGALYGDANRDASLAAMLAALAQRASLALVGPPSGESRAAARALGVTYLAEGFVDRAYADDGSLLPRSEPGAVLSAPEQVAEQALSLAAGHVRSAGGRRLSLDVDTLCLHGDTPDAVRIARVVSRALAEAGVGIRASRP